MAKILFLVVILCSCSNFLLPHKNNTKQFIIHDHKADLQQKLSCSSLKYDKVLMIVNEDALAPFNSNAIFYTKSPNQISRFAINEWVTEPAIMISNNLQLRISQACLYSAVVPDKSFVPANAKLTFQLIRFIADFTNQSQPILVLDARVQLLNNNNSVEKWQSFHLEQPLKQTAISEVIKASDNIVQQLDDQIIDMLQ